MRWEKSRNTCNNFWRLINKYTGSLNSSGSGDSGLTRAGSGPGFFIHLIPSFIRFHLYPVTYLERLGLVARLTTKNTIMAHTYFNQSHTPDYRLIEIYGEEQCRRWETECPEYLAYQSFEMTRGHYLETLDNIDLSKYHFEKLESLDPVNFPVDEPEFFLSKRFNPFRYNLQRSYLNRKYYLIGKSSEILVLYSGEELRKLFNSF